MGKKMMRRCALAASGAMVFGILGFGGGGGCLNGGFRLLGGAVAGGSGFAIGDDLTRTFLTAGITNTQDAINFVNAEEAIVAERAARADAG